MIGLTGVLVVPLALARESEFGPSRLRVRVVELSATVVCKRYIHVIQT